MVVDLVLVAYGYCELLSQLILVNVLFFLVVHLVQAAGFVSLSLGFLDGLGKWVSSLIGCLVGLLHCDAL